MNFHILTLFPEMVENGLKTSIIGRAVAGGLLSIEAVNIRDFAFNKHQSVDDYPYGGGAGMLMQAEPVYLAYKDIEERIQKRIQNAKMQNAETEEQDAEVKVQNAGIQDAETVSPDKKLRVVYLSPQGKTFDQKMAEELAEEEDLVFVIFRKGVVADCSSSYLILAATCQRFDARDGGSIRIVILGLYLETSSNGE